jgi:hypothetical protein
MINDGGFDHPNRDVIWISENLHVLKGGMDDSYGKHGINAENRPWR